MKIKIKLTLGATIAALVLFGSVAAQTNRGTFTDSRDGKTYRMVTIGNQTWMAQKLNFAADEGSWCYDNDVANCDIYGRLYDWETAMTVCPQGWRLPETSDWRTLRDIVGSNPGTKLKSSTGWRAPCDCDTVPVGTDDFGFSALPGGERGSDNFGGETFGNIGSSGFWWTASEDETMIAGARFWFMSSSNMRSNTSNPNEDVYQGWGSMTKGFSVRCVRD